MKASYNKTEEPVTSNTILVAEYWLKSKDPDQFLKFTGEVESIFEVSEEAAKVAVDFIWNTFEPNDLERFKQEIQCNSKNLKPFQAEYKIITKSGKTKHIQASCIPKEHHISGWVWSLFFSDVTASKEEKSDLIKSSFELNRLMSSSKDIICVANESGYFTKINPAATAILGYTTQELLSKPYIEFVLPEDLERTKKLADNIENRKQIESFQNRYLSKNGKIVWLSWTSTFDEETALYYAVARDISKQKGLQLMLNNTARIAQIGGWEYDLINDKIKWTNITNEIFEVDSKKEVTLDYVMSFSKNKRHRELHQSVVDRGIVEGKPWNIEIEIETPTGNVKWIRSIGKAELGDKKCIKLFGSVQDITAKKIAEQKLQQIYQENKVILDSISDAFISLDKKWRVTYWNSTAKRISKLPDYKVLGKNIWDFYPNSSWKEPIIAAKNEQKTISFESYSVQWGIWCEINVYPSDQGVSVYIRDVSLRKKSEAKINLANERYELASEAVNDAIWDWNLKSNKVHWTKGFNTLFGYNKSEYPTNPIEWKNLIHPEDREDVDSSINKVIKELSSSTWIKKYRFRCKNGEYIHVRDTGKIIRDENDYAIRMVGAITDISAQQRYERSLELLNKNLKDKANQLQLSNRELEQFAYVASHDLQEPLRMVNSFLSRLDEKYKHQLDDTARKYINFAVDGGNRMRRMILDLLEYSRVGSSEDHIEDIDLRKIVQEAIIMNQKRIEDFSAIIIVADSFPSIKSHRSPLIQIFYNLISNSLKYSKRDSIPEIKISGVSEGEFIKCCVEDNGVGIKAEFYNKIFTLFQRLHSRDEHSGSGIGLAIVKKMVTKLGGKIWVESAVDEGTKMYFELPKEAAFLKQ